MINKITFVLTVVISIAGLIFPQNKVLNPDIESWKVNYSTVFTDEGQPANESIKKLIEKLSSDSGDGLPVSKEEFINYLKRPSAQEIYSKELIRYATPKSRYNQKQEHKSYKDVFLKEKRIIAGVEFLKEYKTILAAVEREYGVSRKDIVSILMWESGLGEFTGKNYVFNIFMGQLLYLEDAQEYAIQQMIAKGEEYPNEYTDTPQKQKERFAALRNSAVRALTALLRYAKLYNYDPLEQKGSWGGAIGYTQFMPYRLDLAIDGDKDGDVDLFSWPDAIYSVANYLREYGKYGWPYKQRKKAIYSYNHSDDYVHGVIAYADAIWKMYTGK
ncbi:MAG: lytic murein transglycosylase [Bacteroidetes bacterium]|nr:lytic murein transglycosylase [Bacteroidota bacterium]